MSGLQRLQWVYERIVGTKEQERRDEREIKPFPHCRCLLIGSKSKTLAVCAFRDFRTTAEWLITISSLHLCLLMLLENGRPQRIQWQCGTDFAHSIRLLHGDFWLCQNHSHNIITATPDPLKSTARPSHFVHRAHSRNCIFYFARNARNGNSCILCVHVIIALLQPSRCLRTVIEHFSCLHFL